jgi:hypothetical protein
MGVVVDILFYIKIQLWLNSNRFAIRPTLRGVRDAILFILNSSSRLALAPTKRLQTGTPRGVKDVILVPLFYFRLVVALPTCRVTSS